MNLYPDTLQKNNTDDKQRRRKIKLPRPAHMCGPFFLKRENLYKKERKASIWYLYIWQKALKKRKRDHYGCFKKSRIEAAFVSVPEAKRYDS
jgi:hypothetical protein